MPLVDILLFVFLSLIGMGILDVLAKLRALEQKESERLPATEEDVEGIVREQVDRLWLHVIHLPNDKMLSEKLYHLRNEIKRDRREEFLEEKEESVKQREKRLKRLEEAFSLPKSNLE